MQGWDKKCFERLQSMLGLETLKGRDRDLVQDIHDKYESGVPVHFFTGKQRKLIDTLYDKYFDKNGQPVTDRWPAKDKRLRQELFAALDNGSVPSCKLALAEDLARWCRETDYDEITQGRRTLISDLIEIARNSGVQKGLYDDLKDKFESDGIVSGSPAFAESVLKQFDDKGMWTETQQEHIEKMLADNVDPE